MKRLFALLFVFLVMCEVVFAVTYSEGKTLDVYPDDILSGVKFCIQFDPSKKAVKLTYFGESKKLMVMGDKTGTTELIIGSDGSLDYESTAKLFWSNTELFLILASDDGFVAKATISNIDSKDFFVRLGRVGSAKYIVGGEGPAGGIIIYDKGDNTDGWRYLEAAPADLVVISGKPSVDKSDPWYDFGQKDFVFGLYRTNANGDDLYVNGKTVYNEKDCTGTALGTGKKNTELLVKTMGSSAYSSLSKSYTSAYAAKLCSDLEYNGFNDWFLPSKDELNLMYSSLKKADIGNLSNSDYWSSSESKDYGASYVWRQLFKSGYQTCSGRIVSYRVRPIRSF